MGTFVDKMGTETDEKLSPIRNVLKRKRPPINRAAAMLAIHGDEKACLPLPKRAANQAEAPTAAQDGERTRQAARSILAQLHRPPVTYRTTVPV